MTDQEERRLRWLRLPDLSFSPPVTRYTRSPSTFLDPSFSLRRLRTTPARKPRTECCCQPVAFIIASIVAPAGDFSIAITLSCLEPDSRFGRFALRGADWAGLATAAGVADGPTARFFGDFDIEILRSVGGGIAPPPPKPRGGRMALAGAGVILTKRLRICRAGWSCWQR